MKPPLRTPILLALCAGVCAAQEPQPQNLQPTAKGPVIEAPAMPPAATPPVVASAPAPAAANKSAAKGDATDEPYVIGSLDVLDIREFKDPRLSGMFSVGPDGMLEMPLIGEVKADGLTIPELRAVMKQKLETVMNEPEVNIQLAKNNSKKFYIYGGVNRPGEFPLNGKTTLLDAFANCGGFRDFSDKKKIRVMRGTQEFKFNYEDAIKGKHPEQNIVLKTGDRIYVKE